MKEFRNQGWRHFDKIAILFPTGTHSGFAAYRGASGGGTSNTQPKDTVDEDGIEEASDMGPGGDPMALPSVGMNSLPTAAAQLSTIDEALVARAITSTATALNSLVAHPPSMNLPVSAPKVPTSSASRKRPASMLLPDETDNSILFSAAGPPPSTVSSAAPSAAPSAALSAAPSVHVKKRSRPSSSVQAVSGGNSKTTTSVALHAVDSSIRRLNDSISSNYLDPLVSIRDAIGLLCKHPGMPSEYQRYMITQFSSNPTVAVVYMSLPDDARRLDYATDLYKVHNQGGSTSSGTNPAA
jgi:hypothetical protein